MSFSIIIPYRPDNGPRDDIFVWNVRRLGKLMPGTEILTSDCDPGPFNRAQCINRAVKMATEENLLIVDADTVWDPLVHRNAEQILNWDSWGWPFSQCEMLDQATAGSLQAAPYGVYLGDMPLTLETIVVADTHDYLGAPMSGCLVMRNDEFRKVGGFDERFEGWGYEDQAFMFAATEELGHPTRMQGSIYHIWHPRSDNENVGSEVARTNRLRYENYVANYLTEKRSYI